MTKHNLLLFILLGNSLNNTTVGAQELPNIIIIYSDDLGYGDLSCYNDNAKYYTPNLDKMAKEGVLFTDAHSPSTICTPSRPSLCSEGWRPISSAWSASSWPETSFFLAHPTQLKLSRVNTSHRHWRYWKHERIWRYTGLVLASFQAGWFLPVFPRQWRA